MSEKTPRDKPAKSKARAAAKPLTPQERFIADLLARGEAARRDKDGNLPPGVTHEIVDDPQGGPPKLVRRRFSIS